MSVGHYLKPISRLPGLQYRYGIPVSHVGWLPATYQHFPNLCCPYIFVYVVASNTTSHLDLTVACGGPPQLLPTTGDL